MSFKISPGVSVREWSVTPIFNFEYILERAKKQQMRNTKQLVRSKIAICHHVSFVHVDLDGDLKTAEDLEVENENRNIDES